MTPNTPDTDATPDTARAATPKTLSTRLRGVLAPRTLAMMALAGVTAAALTTTAMAERGPGPDGGGEGHGPFSMQNFDTIDADKDGKITQAELDSFRKAEIASADTNADGFMTAEELAGMNLKRMTERATDMATKMVETLDSDADGKLSAAEMTARPMPARPFDRIDADDDGAITKAEAQAAADRMAEGGRGKKKHQGDND
ncbi:MAG: hypothetical protein V4712_14815 [Pseudomonadota bacterium]